MREPIALERRVAVTIWRLATNVEYRTLGELFGLGHSTVGKIVLENCEAIAQHLLQLYMHFPVDQTVTQVIHGFDAKSGFPQFAGAINGTRIPIISPRENVYQCILSDVYIGWPGCVHDACTFSNSGIFTKRSNGQLFQKHTKTINGHNLPIVIVGNPSYPLLP